MSTDEGTDQEAIEISGEEEEEHEEHEIEIKSFEAIENLLSSDNPKYDGIFKYLSFFMNQLT